MNVGTENNIDFDELVVDEQIKRVSNYCQMEMIVIGRVFAYDDYIQNA